MWLVLPKPVLPSARPLETSASGRIQPGLLNGRQSAALDFRRHCIEVAWLGSEAGCHRRPTVQAAPPIISSPPFCPSVACSALMSCHTVLWTDGVGPSSPPHDVALKNRSRGGLAAHHTFILLSAWLGQAEPTRSGLFASCRPRASVSPCRGAVPHPTAFSLG